MSFDEDDLPRIEFEKNPLKMVVAQLRFPPELAIAEPERLAAIQARLRDKYPIALERLSNFEVQLVAVPGVVPQVAPPLVTEGPMRFADAKNEWVASVGLDAISLETKAYRNGEDFRGRLSDFVACLTEIATPARIDRFGVRYVNELRRKEARSVEDWCSLLDGRLMGSIASETLSRRVVRSSEQTWLSIGKDAGSIRRFYVQGPEGAEPASVVVLDFDLFSAEPFSFDLAEIMTRFDRYHKWAWNLFRRSITDELVARLGEAKG